MAVVVFDPAAFKAAFPEFATVPDARLNILFLSATGVIDNTDASVIADVARRSAILSLVVAHLLAQFGTTVVGTGGANPSGVVGRLSSATEGSVSSSFEFNIPASAGAAWWNQTQYGAMAWMLLAPFRSFRYVAIGHSGEGYAHAFADRRLYPEGAQLLSENSGTPNGV
ncbi:virion structural protein [Xanthomonas phage NEB7]|nr:virion structural protein [Xanthomonas phage NEB7]